MSDDIVNDLRSASNEPTEAILVSSDLLIEAADEIDRLRAENARLRAAVFAYVNEKHNDDLWAHAGRAHREQRESSAVRVANAYAELVEIYLQVQAVGR